jgi:hypothetical protein
MVKLRLQLRCQRSEHDSCSKDRPTIIDLGAPARVGTPLLSHSGSRKPASEEACVQWLLYARCGMNRRDVCFSYAHATRVLLHPLETRFITSWKWLRLHTYKCAQSWALRNEFPWGLLCWERNARTDHHLSYSDSPLSLLSRGYRVAWTGRCVCCCARFSFTVRALKQGTQARQGSVGRQRDS